jgi:hypothetical protein
MAQENIMIAVGSIVGILALGGLYNFMTKKSNGAEETSLEQEESETDRLYGYHQGGKKSKKHRRNNARSKRR